MKTKLKLFLNTDSARSGEPETSLRRLFDQRLAEGYELDVIDVTATPQAAEDHRILAIPTLVREHPEPVRRIIGDLTDTEQVAFLLGLLTDSPG
jgi:circadian clock protein KaiB